MANNPQSSGLQFQPIAPTQQGQPFIPVASQQHQPVGHGLTSSNIGMPPVQGQPHQYSQQMQQQPAWLGHPGHALPTSQAVPMQYAQASRPLQPGSSLPQQSAPPYAQFFPPYGQPQNNASVLPQFQPIPQMRAPATPAGGQPWLASGSHSAVPVPPVQTTAQQPSSSYSDQGATSLNAQSSSDWQEHTAADGRRYYYNKKTKQSSWEKPFELMTPIERADASTVWKEFTTPEGKKYYYNKVTKQSKWTIPEELKLAREQAQRVAADSAQSIDIASPATTVTISAGETSSAMASSNADSMSTQPEVTPSSLAVTPVARVATSASAIPVGHSTVGSDVSSVANAATFPTVVGSNAVPAPLVNNQTKLYGAASLVLFPIQYSYNLDASPAINYNSGLDNQDHISQGVARSADGTFLLDSEEGKNDVAAVANVNATPSEERASDDEPLVFANKQEAKNAFKALLESAGVRSDWSWEQAMREIIDDKRYAALKTPGERKQAFNEYLGQRKKIEAEERRIRQKKAREEFMKMLEESKELTSSMKWSKAVSMFENDERFKAVERARDREDLFDNYIVELERKERELAAEERRRNVEEYRKFLESCDYIKVNSQWRKIQDRLEDDERCSRLEKLDRLLIYQDYIRDLERVEEEQKKLQKEQLRRAERKNRDEFRKLMEEHVAAGILTAKTHWLDYCLKVKDLPQYHAVATNTSGSKPKDLFEDVFEELENQYHDDRARVKNVMKSGKIDIYAPKNPGPQLHHLLSNSPQVNIVSTSTLEDFKAAVFDAVGLPAISDINLKLLCEEQIDRAKEKEEKDAKKRQHLADDFTQLLCTFKEITASSSWEDCKPLFEESEEYRLIEESFAREVFEEYVAGLQEKVKEKERKREEEKAKKEKDREEKEKRKEKDRKEKDKDKERERDRGKERMKKDDTDSENVDGTESQSHKEDRKKERKHRKRHHSANDDVISDKDEKEESKKSRRHGSDRKKSRKHAYSPESDTESHHKKHKRDHRDSSRKHGGKEELEDGELGEDGEIRPSSVS